LNAELSLAKPVLQEKGNTTPVAANPAVFKKSLRDNEVLHLQVCVSKLFRVGSFNTLLFLIKKTNENGF
jgi:hypothetical protein